jgi:hypothetical protein
MQSIWKIVALFVLIAATAARAGLNDAPDPKGSPAANAPAPATQVMEVWSVGEDEPTTNSTTTRVIKLNTTIRIRVDELKRWLKEKSLADAKQLVLYVDGLALKGNHPISTNLDKGELAFHLKRTAENRDIWNTLLRRPKFSDRGVSLSVGTESGHQIEIAQKQIGDVTTTRWCALAGVSRLAWGVFFAFIGFLLFFVFRWSEKSSLLRDGHEVEKAGGMPPYSLAKTQVALWSVAILGCYFLLWISTLELAELPNSVLALMALSAMTATGASLLKSSEEGQVTLGHQLSSLLKPIEERRTGIVTRLTDIDGKLPTITDVPARTRLVEERGELVVEDARLKPIADALGQVKSTIESARVELEARLAKRREEVAKAPQDPKTDLEALERALQVTGRPAPHVSLNFIDDILTEDRGISLQRLQMVIWTVALVGVFIYTAWNTLAMPEFSETLLGLMGVSSASYLAAKVKKQ